MAAGGMAEAPQLGCFRVVEHGAIEVFRAVEHDATEVRGIWGRLGGCSQKSFPSTESRESRTLYTGGPGVGEALCTLHVGKKEWEIVLELSKSQKTT
jgi:hypothetical protein